MFFFTKLISHCSRARRYNVHEHRVAIPIYRYYFCISLRTPLVVELFRRLATVVTFLLKYLCQKFTFETAVVTIVTRY